MRTAFLLVFTLPLACVSRNADSGLKRSVQAAAADIIVIGDIQRQLNRDHPFTRSKAVTSGRIFKLLLKNCLSIGERPCWTVGLKSKSRNGHRLAGPCSLFVISKRHEFTVVWQLWKSDDRCIKGIGCVIRVDDCRKLGVFRHNIPTTTANVEATLARIGFQSTAMRCGQDMLRADDRTGARDRQLIAGIRPERQKCDAVGVWFSTGLFESAPPDKGETLFRTRRRLSFSAFRGLHPFNSGGSHRSLF